MREEKYWGDHHVVVSKAMRSEGRVLRSELWDIPTLREAER